jgi:hypothetical protein
MHERLLRLVRALLEWTKALDCVFGWRLREPAAAREKTGVALDADREPQWRELASSIWP